MVIGGHIAYAVVSVMVAGSRRVVLETFVGVAGIGNFGQADIKSYYCFLKSRLFIRLSCNFSHGHGLELLDHK